MTQNEFRLLPQAEQLDLLYTMGVFIGKRKQDNISILLFQLDSFYAEVHYQKHRCFASYILCSRSTDLLEPYLEQIELEDLVY